MSPFCLDHSNDEGLVNRRLFLRKISKPTNVNHLGFHGTEENAIEKGRMLERLMNEHMKVLQLKVECMVHNEGVPDARDDHYIEFHFKVPVANRSEWDRVSW